ncbi:MAG: C40 family peptidase [Thiotrichaceae bacterium]|nr:C40 family peptidase [Thiotrichaceae bacterium]
MRIFFGLILLTLVSSVSAESLSRQVERALASYPEQSKASKSKPIDMNLVYSLLGKPQSQTQKRKKRRTTLTDRELRTLVLDKPQKTQKRRSRSRRRNQSSDWQTIAKEFMGSSHRRPSSRQKTRTRSKPYPYRNVRNAISKARKMINIRYVWGGTTPRGFDCSGLVQYTYRAAGIHLPRTAATQFKATKHIRRQRDARPGDLVFFHLPIARKVYINHVGIYMGSNRILHAPGEGTRIAIDNMDAIRWSQFIVGYGRPMKKVRY